MTELEKVVAVALRDEFCLTKQKAFRMVCVDPDEVARVAVKAVLAVILTEPAKQAIL